MNQIKSNQIKCWFLRRGENRSSRRKTSWSRVENQQTQPTYDAGSGNRTRNTLVEGERSHHCANPALKHSFPIPPVGVKIGRGECSMFVSSTLLEYWRFFSFSCRRYICCGSRFQRSGDKTWHQKGWSLGLPKVTGTYIQSCILRFFRPSCQMFSFNILRYRFSNYIFADHVQELCFQVPELVLWIINPPIIRIMAWSIVKGSPQGHVDEISVIGQS